MKYAAIALAFALALSACTAARDAALYEEGKVASLTEFALEDLKAAHADALAHDDVIAATCWAKLAEKVAALPGRTETQAVGAFSAYQKARNVRRAVTNGISDDIKLACAALVADARRGVLSLPGAVLNLVP